LPDDDIGDHIMGMQRIFATHMVAANPATNFFG
jgi:hypothetical protein